MLNPDPTKRIKSKDLAAEPELRSRGRRASEATQEDAQRLCVTSRLPPLTSLLQVHLRRGLHNLLSAAPGLIYIYIFLGGGGK